MLGKPRPGTVGTTYDGVQCRIDKDSGEIQVKGECLMLGYYKQPEVTKATMTDDGWLKTGDKGTIDAEGNLKITGRVKDLFKTGKGKYVAPAPIEDKLSTHPAIEACCVTGANLGQPLGLLMLNPDAAAKCKDAAGRAALETSLAEHLKAVNAKLDPHEQMDCVVITADAWTRRERHPHADHEGQAQQDRGHLRRQLREVGRHEEEGDLVERLSARPVQRCRGCRSRHSC